MIRGKFYCDVYDCNIHLIIAKDIVKPVQALEKKQKEKVETKEELDKSKAISYRSDKHLKDYYIFCQKEFFTIDTFNHEKAHIAEFVLEDRDMPIGDEIRAYFEGYLSHKFEELFRKLKIRPRFKRK